MGFAYIARSEFIFQGLLLKKYEKSLSFVATIKTIS